MENCLVTKLKAEVENTSLRKIGEMPIKVVNANSDKFRLLNSDGNKIAIRTAEDVTVINDPSNNNVYLASGSGYIFALQDEIDTLLLISDVFHYRFNDLIYCQNIRYLIINCDSIDDKMTDISKFSEHFDLLRADLRGTLWEGDINSLPDTLTEFSIGSCPGINGSFDSFGKKPLTKIGGFRGTNVAGTIEGFVATARKPVAQGGANRQTGSLLFESTFACLYITFQGQQITGKNDVTLSWTADTITFNGVTINA